MFSPILPTSAVRVVSTVPPPSGSADSAATSAGLLLGDQFGAGRWRTRGSRRSWRRNRSSQFTSTIAPSLPSADMIHADDAFGGDAGRRLARLVAELDAQDLLGLGQVAVGFGQRLLAFHHRRVGLLAQFLDHACGNFRHSLLLQLSLTTISLQKRGVRPFRAPTLGAHAIPALRSTSTNSSSPPVTACTTPCNAAGLAFEHGIGDAAGIQADRHGSSRRCPESRKSTPSGRVVGVDHADDRDAELAGFGARQSCGSRRR